MQRDRWARPRLRGSEHDLVDQLRLKIFPVVLGTGDRRFGQTSNTRPLSLINTQTLGDGIAYLTYERPLPVS
jgi:hypothetical protein